MPTYFAKITGYDIGIAVLFIALGFTPILWGLNAAPGGQAVVIIDNIIIDVIDLTLDDDHSFSTQTGNIEVEVRDGKIRVSYSNCPLKICRKHGFISRRGEILVCLPNKFMIYIQTGEASGIDGVTG